MAVPMVWQNSHRSAAEMDHLVVGILTVHQIACVRLESIVPRPVLESSSDTSNTISAVSEASESWVPSDVVKSSPGVHPVGVRVSNFGAHREPILYGRRMGPRKRLLYAGSLIQGMLGEFTVKILPKGNMSSLQGNHLDASQSLQLKLMSNSQAIHSLQITCDLSLAVEGWCWVTSHAGSIPPDVHSLPPDWSPAR